MKIKQAPLLLASILFMANIPATFAQDTATDNSRADIDSTRGETSRNIQNNTVARDVGTTDTVTTTRSATEAQLNAERNVWPGVLILSVLAVLIVTAGFTAFKNYRRRHQQV